MDKMATISQTISYMQFREWKGLHFNQKSTEVCSIHNKTGLENGLAPYRRQAIVWTNTGPIIWPIYAALGGDELIVYQYCIFSLAWLGRQCS